MSFIERAAPLTVAVAAVASMAVGLAYAARDREFDLPVTATVILKIESAVEAADINNDGKVDAADLRIVARNISSSSVLDGRADVDKNGEVNIFDLSFVARHFDPAIVNTVYAPPDSARMMARRWVPSPILVSPS